MAYLLDPNVFIAAKNQHYGFDICPGFWSWLDQAGQAGIVRSVEAVYQELLGQSDDLAKWVRDHRQMFSAPTNADIAAVAEVNRWATESTLYNEGATADFAAAADSFLPHRTGRPRHGADPAHAYDVYGQALDLIGLEPSADKYEEHSVADGSAWAAVPDPTISGLQRGPTRFGDTGRLVAALGEELDKEQPNWRVFSYCIGASAIGAACARCRSSMRTHGCCSISRRRPVGT